MASFIQNQFEQNFVTTSVDYVFNWARKSSVWPVTFGLPAVDGRQVQTSRMGSWGEFAGRMGISQQ